MLNAKQEVARILDELPEDCTLEEIQYRLFVAETIRKRLDESQRGEFVSHADAEKRLESWLRK